MAVQRETEYLLRWDELDEATATNLYLYGTLETPEALYDRIYPAGYEGGAFGGPRVLVDAVSYMADGPGQFDTLRLRLIKTAARVVEMKSKIKIHLPTSAPDQAIWHLAIGRLPRLII